MKSWALEKSAAAVAVAALCAMASPAEAGYMQTNLVSDIPGLAQLTDPELVNPWGISFSSTSPIWVSDQGTNFTQLYSITGLTPTKVTAVNPPTGNIMIPPGGTGAVGPTGQVNNSFSTSLPSSFPVNGGGNMGAAHFIFANLNGTISAWDTGSTAFIQATTTGAVYSGLAIASVAGTPYIYAANDAATGGGIRVFDGNWNDVTSTTFAGKFVDPNPISGYVPFNVQNIGGQIYVTYAPATMGADRTPQTMATPGHGYVDVFDSSGNFIRRVITGSELAAPWGIALAPPTGFGQFSGDLLVGNFSYADSVINAFDPLNNYAFVGSIPIGGSGYMPGGLWALEFGIGGSNGSPDTLYFTNGIDGETHGLFGAITVAVAEPPGLTVLAAGFVFLGVWQFARRSRAART